MMRSVLIAGACGLVLLVAAACVVADYGPAYRPEPYPDYDVYYYWWGWPYWDGYHHHHHGWHHDGGGHRFHH